MFSQILLVSCLSLTAVLCEPPVPQYGVPFNNGYNNNNNGYNGNVGGHGVNGNAPTNTYGVPNNGGSGNGQDGHDNNDHHGYGEPKAYEFGYQVKDDYTGTNYNRQEQSDGNQVTGSYRVALPDGRIQIVTYYADWKTGFHADVRYEGEAQFPDQYNTNNGYANNGYGNGGYNNNNNNGGYPQNNNGVYNNAPSNQYGAPVNPVAVNNHYSAPSTGYGAPTTGAGYNNNNYDYDSYSSGYNNVQKPNTGYGAP